MSEFPMKFLKKETMEGNLSQSKEIKKSPRNFRLPGNELQTNTSTKVPEEKSNSHKSKKKESEEEKLEREKNLRRYFELEKKIQNDERMSFLQHRRREEEYLLEQEKLAETWMTLLNKRRQLVEENEKNRNEKTSSWRGQRSGGQARAPNYKKWNNKWNNKKGPFGKKMRETQTQTPEMSNSGDLGEEFCEKLTFSDKQ